MNKTPKLRFKEFSGEWESKKLSDLCSDFIVPMRDKPQVFDGDIPWCRIEDIEGKYLMGTKSNQYVSQETIEKMNLKVYPTGTLICSCSAAIGNNAITTRPLITNQTFIGIVCDSINNEYLYYLMGTKKRNLEEIAGGTTIPYISRKKFEEFNVTIPSIEEQEKIASFFSLIDKKISLQSEKVEMLKEYKKGMMQKIFSRELRFKDDSGRDYPEWEEKKLGKLIKIKSERNKNNEIELVLSVSNTKGFIRQADQFEDRVVASSDISNYKIVENGDFAFNPARINVGSIARLKLYDKGVISPMYICFKTLGLLDDDYLEYFLMTSSFDIQMKKKLEGSVRQTLSAEALGQIVIKLPCLSEQKKIGLFLNTINDKLKKEEEKLDSLNEYKKGLLQQMFV